MLRFSAPRDFDPRVYAEYLTVLPLAKYASEATVWVCNPNAQFVIDGSTLDSMPELRILATPSTGTNHIDLDACEKRGVKVLSLLNDRAGLETISASAEFTFMLLLEQFKRPPRRELQGKRVGLVGYGRIGRKIDLYCDTFGATCFRNDPVTIKSVDIEKTFQTCDAVVVCCSLTDETRGMIKHEHIISMKPYAVLVNTARGEVLDEDGLYAALIERPDIRFATDVVHGEVEGRGEESRQRLIELGAMVTNHIAGETFESRTKAAKIILGLLRKEL